MPFDRLPPLSRWWTSRPLLVQDGAAGLVLAVVAVAFPGNGVVLGQLAQRPTGTAGTVVAGLLAVGQALPLALLRVSPRGCLRLVAVAFALHQLLGMPATPASLGLFVALIGAGSHRTILLMAEVTVAYVVFVIVLTALGSPLSAFDAVSFYLMLAACLAAGAALRIWRNGEERRRRAGIERAIGAERSRIARELHDVVTHHVTTMVVQADLAYAVLGGSLPPARRAVAAVSESGRQALTELRDLLHVLDASDDRSEQPLQVRLGELVERIRAAGQPIDFTVEGAAHPVTAEVELTLYRVLQEALTNALKHAPRRPTVVGIDYRDPARIVADVTTTGRPGRAVGRPGRGLAGLHERVEAVGGTLSITAVPEGRFRVRAELPA